MVEGSEGQVGVVLVDHGSRIGAANDALDDVVEAYRAATSRTIVEAAHMELAEPTIEQAFASCVEQGAAHVVIHPYFLAPGRHSTEDIPRMAGEAAAKFPDISYCVTEPLGLDPRMAEVVDRRVREALALAGQQNQS